jgi:hypothetical protein
MGAELIYFLLGVLLSQSLFISEVFGDTITPTPLPGRSGNLVLEAPEGFPSGLDGSLNVQTARPPYKKYTVSLAQGITIPAGDYVLSNRGFIVNGYPVTVSVNKQTVVKVSAVYASMPLSMTPSALTVNMGQGGPLGCTEEAQIDPTKPFVILFPGENQLGGGRRFYMGKKGSCEVNPYLRMPDDRASLVNVDSQLVILDLHFEDINPDFPDEVPLEICGRTCLPARSVPGGKIGTPIQFNYWLGDTISLQYWKEIFAREYKAVGGQSLQLLRLEVDHMHLPDGNILPGTYDVYQGTKKIIGRLNTRTGIDLLPGQYRVEVSGEDEAGQLYFTEHEVMLALHK